jgi:hypothetical protein
LPHRQVLLACKLEQCRLCALALVALRQFGKRPVEALVTAS